MDIRMGGFRVFRWIWPSYYPSVFHSRMLYYTIFTIKVSCTAEHYTLVTGDRWHVTYVMWQFLHIWFFVFGPLSTHIERLSVSRMQYFFKLECSGQDGHLERKAGGLAFKAAWVISINDFVIFLKNSLILYILLCFVFGANLDEKT